MIMDSGPCAFTHGECDHELRGQYRDDGLMRDIDRLGALLRYEDISRDAFIERCLAFICKRISCSRAGLWLFLDKLDGPRSLRCASMYDSVESRTLPSAMKWEDVDAAYFAELSNRGKVVADDVCTNPVTARHYDAYFRSQDIRSFLAVACSLNGKIIGAFTCSKISSSTVWSANQIKILTQIGARATIILSDQFSYAAETTAPNAYATLRLKA